MNLIPLRPRLAAQGHERGTAHEFTAERARGRAKGGLARAAKHLVGEKPSEEFVGVPDVPRDSSIPSMLDWRTGGRGLMAGLADRDECVSGHGAGKRRSIVHTRKRCVGP